MCFQALCFVILICGLFNWLYWNTFQKAIKWTNKTKSWKGQLFVSLAHVAITVIQNIFSKWNSIYAEILEYKLYRIDSCTLTICAIMVYLPHRRLETACANIDVLSVSDVFLGWMRGNLFIKKWQVIVRVRAHHWGNAKTDFMLYILKCWSPKCDLGTHLSVSLIESYLFRGLLCELSNQRNTT